MRSYQVKTLLAVALMLASVITNYSHVQAASLAPSDYARNNIYYYSELLEEACSGTPEWGENESDSNLVKIFKFILSRGASPKVAAAVVGNIYQESKGDPLLRQGGTRVTDPSKVGRYKDGSLFENKPGQSSVGDAWGLAQWDPGNAVLYWQKRAGISGNITLLNTQLELIWWQLKNYAPTSKRNVLAEMEAASSVDAATDIMVRRFFGAGKPMLKTRQQKANEALTWLESDPSVAESFEKAAATCTANSAINAAIATGGLTEAQAKALVMNYGENKGGDSRRHAGADSWSRCGGNGANCVTFSRFFLNKFTSTKIKDGEATGNGDSVVSYLSKKGVKTGSEPRVGAIFSWAGGEYGHTGVVLGIHDGKVIVGQASCTDGNNGFKGRGTGDRKTGRGAAFVLSGDPKTGRPWYKPGGASGVTFAYPEVNMQAIQQYFGGGA